MAGRAAIRVLICSCSTLGAVSLLLQRGPNSPNSPRRASTPIAKQHDSLRSLYKELRAKTFSAAAANHWPDRSSRASLGRGLTSNATHVWPNRFNEHGPLQVAAFLDKNVAAMALIQKVRHDVFEPFVASVLDALGKPARERVAAGVYWPASHSLHVVMTVFSEHPSLLDEAQRQRWQPVSVKQEQMLATRVRICARSLLHLPRLDAYRFVSRMCQLRTTVLAPGATPPLAIDFRGCIVTPDGSMIATFVEADTGASLGDLRTRLSTAGTTELGELNSRPKKLIHVTVGRLLTWPYELLDAAAAERVGRVVASWADSLEAKRGTRERLWLTELELVRDVRWMMGEKDTIATFALE